MEINESVPWGLIVFTLVVRFAAVFLVLCVLGAGIAVAGKIVPKLLALRKQRTSDA